MNTLMIGLIIVIVIVLIALIYMYTTKKKDVGAVEKTQVVIDTNKEEVVETKQDGVTINVDKVSSDQQVATDLISEAKLLADAQEQAQAVADKALADAKISADAQAVADKALADAKAIEEARLTAELAAKKILEEQALAEEMLRQKQLAENPMIKLIEITNNTGGTLQLVEVEVYDTTGTNIALLGTAEQNTRNPIVFDGPNVAIDGKYNVWADSAGIHYGLMSTAYGDKNYWRVTLKDPVIVSYIVITPWTNHPELYPNIDGAKLNLINVNDIVYSTSTLYTSAQANMAENNAVLNSNGKWIINMSPASNLVQYVRIEKPYNDAPESAGSVLNIAEVEVYDKNMINIALNKPASQVDTYLDAGASRAVDGNTSGHWNDGSVIHTTNNNPLGWWEVNLGAVQAVSKLVIWNRTDCCKTRIIGIKVYLLDKDRKIYRSFGPITQVADKYEFLI